MKKLKTKILKKLNNAGSSIVMVIVALGFIGIVVAALLSAAGYAYRLKLQDINSRDNYYYVEQAMNEIYAGVGAQTMQDMQNAYVYTVEHMVYYDLGANGGAGGYSKLSDEAATEMFKNKFLENLSTNTFFDTDKLPTSLQNLITNETVQLDKTRLTIIKDKTGITLKNVTLSRVADYDKSTARGTYTQTLTTDIVISEPDCIIKFNGTESDFENILNYAVVADMGVEVTQSTPLTITGNIYAASDYYNKDYNESTYDPTVSDDDKVIIPYKVYGKDADGEDITYDYKHGSVTSRSYDPDSPKTSTYYNVYSTLNDKESEAGSRDFFNGEYSRSANSGFYVDGATVTVMADDIVVPGTIAVMNTGTLSIYGKEGKKTSDAEIWTDNIVLGGYSKKGEDDEGNEIITGSSAFLRANLFVKDDTELNAPGANFQLRGSYYGYGDSTEKDDRVFIPTVDTKNFQVEYTDAGKTVTENRGHYNSSAIIVNGENSTLNLSETYTIFLAGRSYIELSKHVENEEYTIDEEGNVVENEADLDNDGNVDVIRQKYEYTPTITTADNETVYIRDYKTGESISVKSNQVAYIPVTATSAPTKSEKGNYYLAKLPTALSGIDLFLEHFPQSGEFAGGLVPCVAQDVSGKRYYYYDFETAYKNLSATAKAEYDSAQDLAADFIQDYVDYYNELAALEEEEELSDADAVIKSKLVDLGNFEDFDFSKGKIVIPDPDASTATRPINIYSSGTITTKANTSFNMITNDDVNTISKLLDSYNVNKDTDSGDLALEAFRYSNNLELEYDYVKWNLGHYTNVDDTEKLYINDLIADKDFSEADLTPINRFLYMNKIDSNIAPAEKDTDAGSTVLNLKSGYRVWIDTGLDNEGNMHDVIIKDKTGGNGRVRGIVVTKGDVYFDKSVSSFEGLIVAGGKVYITENLQNMSSSSELCKRIFEECQLSKDESAKKVLEIFRGYEDVLEDSDSDDEYRKIDTIDYSDIVSFDNWMKNVE